jgi:hypothetical protein
MRASSENQPVFRGTRTKNSANGKSVDGAESDEPGTEEETTSRARPSKKTAQNKPKTAPQSILRKAANGGVFADPDAGDWNPPKSSEDEEDGVAPTGEDDSLFVPQSDDSVSMFGLLPTIFRIVDSTIKYRSHVYELWGRDYRKQKQLDPISEFDVLRQKLRTAYKDLTSAVINDEDPDQAQKEIDDSLPLIVEMAEKLNPDQELAQSRKLTTQTYAYVFMDLVRVFTGAVHCHQSIILHQGTTEEQPNLHEIGELIAVAEAIVALGEKSRSWKIKVDSDLALVKPVLNDIVAPFKRVLKELLKQRNRLEREQHNARVSKKLREQLDHEEEVQSQRVKDTESFERRVDRLRLLYAARQAAEPNPIRKISKKFHMPDVRSKHRKRYPLDSDANGVTFERVPVFRQRSVGSHIPDAEGDVADDDWDVEEIVALEDALKTCHGMFKFPERNPNLILGTKVEQANVCGRGLLPSTAATKGLSRNALSLKF